MLTKRVLRKSLTQWLPTWPRFLVRTAEGRSNQQSVKLKKSESKQWEAKLVKQKSKKFEKIKFNISSQSQKPQARIVSTKTMRKMKEKCSLETEQRH